jgi:hypothetical protein
MVRGLLKGALMLALGALITWWIAGVLQDRATVANNKAADQAAPGVAASKPSASHWMF